MLTKIGPADVAVNEFIDISAYCAILPSTRIELIASSLQVMLVVEACELS